MFVATLRAKQTDHWPRGAAGARRGDSDAASRSPRTEPAAFRDRLKRGISAKMGIVPILFPRRWVLALVDRVRRLLLRRHTSTAFSRRTEA